MAKASDKAKELIFNTLSTAFSTSAIIDKKLYINLDVEGETVQIAVSLTAPKTKVELNTGVTKVETVKITEAEIQKQKEEVKDIFDFFKI